MPELKIGDNQRPTARGYLLYQILLKFKHPTFLVDTKVLIFSKRCIISA